MQDVGCRIQDTSLGVYINCCIFTISRVNLCNLVVIKNDGIGIGTGTRSVYHGFGRDGVSVLPEVHLFHALSGNIAA